MVTDRTDMKDEFKNGEEKEFLLLYASQTGQAKAIAEEFNQLALNDDLSPRLFCISQSEKEFFLEKENCAVFVVSTTGEGEPPETALKFWRKIKRPSVPKDYLAHLSFTVLGLGDTNYTNFCNFGQMLNRRLVELGAKHFSSPAWADDGVGLEVVVEPWKEETFYELTQHLQNKAKGTSENKDEDLLILTSTINATLIENMTTGFENSVNLSSCENVSEDVVLPDKTLYQENGVPSLKHIATNAVELNSDLKQINNSANQSVTENNMHGIATSIINAELHNTASNLDSGQKIVHSLTHSLMSDIPLTLPLSPPRFLKVIFLPDEVQDNCYSMERVIQNGCPFPGARSPVSHVPIKSAKRLTNDSAVKTALQIDLDISGCGWSYEPGDTIAVICPNDAREIHSLLARLDVTNLACNLCCLEVLPDTRKKNAQVPEFLPQKSTLFEIFRTCCEIREPPRKVFLRALVGFTEDANEKRRLQELCSKQGSDDYAKFIRGPNLSLLDIFSAFPSCKPPIEVLLENVPRLQPRAYSVSSSPLDTPPHLQFVFNILRFSADDGRSEDRNGVCTGWLDYISRNLQDSDLMQIENDKCIGQNTIDESYNEMIPVFLRTNRFFRMPSELSVPLVMIGPGTGVAPFVGFLQHRSHLVLKMDAATSLGDTWLFYGCRKKNADFLFKKELERFVSEGILTRLYVSHSRDMSQPANSPRYVQDSMKICGKELIALVHDRTAQVFVCGDAKGMAPDVYRIFISLLQLYKGMDESSAEAFMTAMRVQRRYLEDVWV